MHTLSACVFKFFGGNIFPYKKGLNNNWIAEKVFEQL